MLRSLFIRDFAIIEQLELEFGDGFTAITGETGAGKSILIDALALLSGRRADVSAIRDGAEKAELSAEFEPARDGRAAAWLEAQEMNQGSDCLVRRVISRNGRSRAWINGTLVTLQQLQSLGDCLVEIHGQNEHIHLVRAGEPLRLLDSAGEHAALAESVAEQFNCWRRLKDEEEELLSQSPLSEGDRDLLRFQIDELEAAAVSAGEFAELELEQRRLAGGRSMIEALEQAYALLENDDSGASGQLQAAIRELATYTELDADIAACEELLNEAAIQCTEAVSSLQQARARIEINPERLLEVETSLSTLHELARKHRVEPEDLSDTLQRLRDRHENSGSLDERLEEVRERLLKTETAYRSDALRLNEARKGCAGTLASEVTARVRQLGMEKAEFRITVDHDSEGAPSARGNDTVSLLVSANPGQEPAPLKKVASGGELSRISLALRTAVRAEESAPVQLFDEVDAGIGGEAAVSVGRLLRRLAAGRQCLCVTHLPQVAVCADQQFRISKSSSDSVTSVDTQLLSEDQRVEEIARMLGGRVSEQSRAHAAEMLSLAATEH